MTSTLLIVLVARAAAAAAPCGFRDFFDRNLKGPGIHKWLHYFPAYEREFGEWCAESAAPIRMLEIGIQSGGSCKMWLNRFGTRLELLVGVDINPGTKAWESFGPNIKVEIGSQDDPKLWQRLRSTYGGFDIIIDDGAHTSEHMIASFRQGFGLVKSGGVYLIEDAASPENIAALRSILNGDPPTPGKAAEPELRPQRRFDGTRFEDLNNSDVVNRNYAPIDLITEMNRRSHGAKVCCKFGPNWVQRNIEYVTAYPGLLAIRKRAVPLDVSDSNDLPPAGRPIMKAPKHGTKWIPYH